MHLSTLTSKCIFLCKLLMPTLDYYCILLRPCAAWPACMSCRS